MYVLVKKNMYLGFTVYTITYWLANRMEGRNTDMVGKLNGGTENVCAYMFYKCSNILSLASASFPKNDGALFLR